MMPGRINPRQMNQMMKRLGINVKEIENVEKVIIITDKKEYIFENAEVTIMDAQGSKTYQITGNPNIIDKKDETKKEDIKRRSKESIGRNKWRYCRSNFEII